MSSWEHLNFIKHKIPNKFQLLGLLRGVARIFKAGGSIFIEKGKAGSEQSERCLRTFMRLFYVRLCVGRTHQPPWLRACYCIANS